VDKVLYRQAEGERVVENQAVADKVACRVVVVAAVLVLVVVFAGNCQESVFLALPDPAVVGKEERHPRRPAERIYLTSFILYPLL
jgi:hypothetical protein